MTEDEAIERMVYDYYSLKDLPDEFHTKEFVIKAIFGYSRYITPYELRLVGVVIDYDIALAYESKYQSDMERLVEHWYPDLDMDEINKLYNTIQLLK